MYLILFFLNWPKIVKLFIWLSASTILSLLAKPSYIICLVPAVFFLILYKRIQNQKSLAIPVSISFLLPSFLVLFWQYRYQYNVADNVADNVAAVGSLTGDPSIVFAPFAVITAHFNWPLVFIGFIFSVTFPLFVYLAYFKAAQKSLELNLAWLTFSFGLFYFYFLAEVRYGVISLAANFVWSAQLSLFVLFFVSLLFFIKQSKFYDQLYFLRNLKISKLNKRFCLGLFIFLLHFLGGVVYIIFVTKTKSLGIHCWEFR